MLDKLGKICPVDKQRLVIAEKGHIIKNQRFGLKILRIEYRVKKPDKFGYFPTNVHSHMLDKLGKICLVDKQRLIIAEKGHVIENQRGHALRANIVKLPREN